MALNKKDDSIEGGALTIGHQSLLPRLSAVGAAARTPGNYALWSQGSSRPAPESD